MGITNLINKNYNQGEEITVTLISGRTITGSVEFVNIEDGLLGVHTTVLNSDEEIVTIREEAIAYITEEVA